MQSPMAHLKITPTFFEFNETNLLDRFSKYFQQKFLKKIYSRDFLKKRVPNFGFGYRGRHKDLTPPSSVRFRCSSSNTLPTGGYPF